MAEKPRPVRVPYCAVCSLPAEYCEFGPDFDKCKPWLVQNAPELYPDLLKEANERDAVRAADQLQATGISDGGGGGGVGVGPSTQSGSTSASKPEEVKRLPGGKIKKKNVMFGQTKSLRSSSNYTPIRMLSISWWFSNINLVTSASSTRNKKSLLKRLFAISANVSLLLKA